MYEQIFEEADEGIAINDVENGTMGVVNQRYAEMLGYEPAELEDMRIEAVSADDPSFDQAVAMERVEAALDGEPQRFDWLFERRDGSTFWGEVSLKRTTIDGEVRLLAFARDVSERKQRERELEFFEELVESIGIGVGVNNEAGEFEYVNQAYADIFDTDRETLEAAKIWEVNPEFDRDRLADYWASFEHGETRIEETTQSFDGTEVAVQTLTTAKEINDERYHFGTARDISDRKAREQRFRAFVERSNDVIAVLDETGAYQYLSPSSERVLGYEPSELQGSPSFEKIHPADRERVLAEFEAGLAEPMYTPEVEYRFDHGDEGWRWIESRGFNQLENDAIEGFVVNSRDITARKRLEQRTADLHDATREMVRAADEDEICRIALEKVQTLFDDDIAAIWTPDRTGDRLEPVAATDEAQEMIDDVPVYTAGNSLSWAVYDSGDHRYVEDVETEPEAYGDDPVVRSELIVPLGEYGVMNIGATDPAAFSDNEVALANLLGANVQVALGRSVRERNLERQTEKMEFFNSILRHDVLNAVTVIKSRGEFLAEDLEGEQLQDAETIVSWSEDVREIVQRVRTVLETLTREGDPQLEAIHLPSALRAEIDRVRETYPAVTFDLECRYDGPVLANELLGDVLGNILTNAIEHNERDGLVVSATVEQTDDAVVTRIADDGGGVSDDRKEAIFRRGETGHAKSIGSGFGLFFVDAMVSEYGGEVRVEDNEAGGATFVIRFPTTDALESAPD
jgi:PAS domain S-box-containing protein